MADGLDFTQLIGKRQEFAATFEEFSLEICADAVYQDGNLHPIDNLPQLFDLRSCKELPFVDQQAVKRFRFMVLLYKSVKIFSCREAGCGTLSTNPRGDPGRALAIIDLRFQ